MEEEKKQETKPAAEPAKPSQETLEEPAVYVVGLGQTGRELIVRLSAHIRVVGIDLEESKIESAKKRVGEGRARFFKKDGTSRITWEDLGLSEDDTVVSTARRDEINLETLRIAGEVFKVRRLLGLIHSASRAEEYASIGVETISRAQVLAGFLESRVLLDKKTAQGVGLGHGEIIEVPILPGSPVIGRKLSTFRARPWLVGAIYRKERLIVPHGNTVLKENDRVVLIGEPHILAGISDFFKMGEPEFPLQYGPRIGVLDWDAKLRDVVVSESNYLARNSKAVSMAILHVPGTPEPDMGEASKICGGTNLSCEPAYLPDEEHKPWPKMLQAQDFGCLVMNAPRMGVLRRLGLRRSILHRILDEADFPVLISRGTHPYEHILVPVAMKGNPIRVAELAINLARLFKSRLDAVTVTEPVFSAGEEAVDEQKQVLDRVEELTSLYRLSVNIKHREGNPIKEIVEQAKDYSLVVMGHRKEGKTFMPHMDLTLEILDRVECSVMIMPYSEDKA